MEPVAFHNPLAATRPIIGRIIGLWMILALASGILAPISAQAANQNTVRIGHQRFSKQVRSIAELRWNNLTRQGWDMSCGAAALSTLLTYHHGQPFSELAVTLTILKNSDPSLVKSRGGFSLFDLKRFVRAVGLEGVGYGQMTLEDLNLFALPAILPVKINDLDHFVIFRKIIGNHVLLGDPAFGNISMPASQFQSLWQSRIAFYVVTPEEKDHLSASDAIRKTSPMAPTLMESAIPSFRHGSRIINRIPGTPPTRRPTAVTP